MLSLLIGIIGHAQTSEDFKEKAFLIDNKNTLAIYQDSVGGKVIATVRNKPDSDEYYVFQVQSVFGRRIKVSTCYTIDAGHYNNTVINGWVDYGKLGVYCDQVRCKYFANSKANRQSHKISLALNVNQNPSKIISVRFLNHRIWLKVQLREENGSLVTGWLPPELQCMDIWNACECH